MNSNNHVLTIKAVHGWGMSSQTWAALHASLLPKPQKTVWHCLDLGFAIEPAPSYKDLDYTMQAHATDQADYIIGHSLGGLWALKHAPRPKRGYIFINSFYRFTDFTPAPILTQMQKALRRDPAQAMERFLTQAGLADYTPITDKTVLTWNPERLLDGLEWLKTWDMQDTITQIHTSHLPILCLSGATDQITPAPAMTQHWDGYDLIMHPQAGHALPLSHAPWCAEQINHWIKTHHAPA